MLTIHLSFGMLLLGGTSYSLYSPQNLFIAGIVKVFITYFYFYLFFIFCLLLLFMFYLWGDM